MTESQITQVAFATDQAGVGPCALAIYSALRATTGDVAIHVLHAELADQDIIRLKTAVDLFTHGTLYLHPMHQTAMQTVAIDHLYITTMALARLLLPDLLQGRVIYLDLDTIVRSDLSVLANTDLKGKVAAAVRDFGIVDMQNWANYAPKSATKREAKRIARAERRVADTNARLGADMIADYFNSGVLVLDCDAISNDKTLANAFRDVQSASAYELLDQDWLNIVLKDRVQLIDPKWNSFWGNPKSGTKRYPSEMQQAYAASRDDPAIVHFSGRFKPWNTHFSHYYSHRRHWIWRFHAISWTFWFHRNAARLRRRPQTSDCKTQP